jgi:hypothetical protein
LRCFFASDFVFCEEESARDKKFVLKKWTIKLRMAINLDANARDTFMLHPRESHMKKVLKIDSLFAVATHRTIGVQFQKLIIQNE